MDLLAAWELELGPETGHNHMLFILQLVVGGHYDLANVDWATVPGLQRHCVHLSGALRLGTAYQT